MRVVATLTTRPEIKDFFKDNLESLTSQFDEVYLGIPYESHKGIKYPDISYEGVTIVRLEKDIGPCSKLLGALIKEKRDPNTLIVSVDDDYIYNKKLRSVFEKKRENDIKNNKDRVFTFSGLYMKYWNYGTYGLNGGWHNKNYFFDFNNEKKLTTIAGYCGCAYPANIFKETEHFINFAEECFKKNDKLFYNDDVVISAYLSRLNIERIRISMINNDIGRNNKMTSDELAPSEKELYETIYSLKEDFQNNNPKKYTVVLLDIIIFLSIMFILLVSYLIYYFKYK